MSVVFCGSLNNNFSMSVGCLWDVFGMFVGLNILKRIICNVCGVLWDSIYIKKKHLQCLWGSVGLSTLYTKKKWSRLLEITFNHFCGVLWVLWCIVGFSHAPDWRYDCTDYKNGFDFFMRLVKWPKIAVKKCQNLIFKVNFQRQNSSES